MMTSIMVRNHNEPEEYRIDGPCPFCGAAVLMGEYDGWIYFGECLGCEYTSDAAEAA